MKKREKFLLFLPYTQYFIIYRMIPRLKTGTRSLFRDKRCRDNESQLYVYIPNTVFAVFLWQLP